MLYCSNSSCSNPFNPDDNKFCIKCGQTLTPLFRNRFRVIRLLGEGGFSRTYEARDVDKRDEPCVIKQFVPQFEGTAALEKATELFKQEAKRLYDLGEHPQIPRLIAYFEQDKRLYLVQELIQGQNLLQELQQQGAFSEEKIKQLLTDLLPILKFIHERGVIHRDIKPENIMRRLDGKLILIDFGVSKQITKTFVGVGTTVGTPGYTPLEQMRGQVFPASDLYSLGVTCIRLLTQCLPQIDTCDELYDALKGSWVWRERLPQGQSVTPQLGQVLDKLIQNYVKERYQSIDEILKDYCNDLPPESNIELKLLPFSIVGTWSGKSRSRNHIFVTLCIAKQDGNSFDGNLNVRDVGLGWTYRIKIKGTINPKTSEVIIQEDDVYSEHWWWKWEKGISEAKISADGNGIFGKRKTSAQSDDFFLLRIDHEQMLISLLEAGKWKDADRVTGTLMLKISCQEQDGWLNSESIKRFPCQDIIKINELWLKYSNGRFGFSVQREIWLKLDCDWIKVGDRLGWRVNNCWKEYSELTFSIDAPEGAFPTFWGGEGRKLIFGYSGAWEDFLALIRSCKL
ncbi:serine/threonine-protein kinase [Nostoc sp. XA010]|uniref:serine/threonine-protein kinase n=1 Tax=Nostoc sp. XA010 TaxID=2780407 RepID=UPI001E3971E0|nr:serine/threonine-protein kinase [Nostoc sp. XA010]MCC5657360.1 serine/threonine-protein kinase [Nostoc sp. XA010]